MRALDERILKFESVFTIETLYSKFDLRIKKIKILSYGKIWKDHFHQSKVTNVCVCVWSVEKEFTSGKATIEIQHNYVDFTRETST